MSDYEYKPGPEGERDTGASYAEDRDRYDAFLMWQAGRAHERPVRLKRPVKEGDLITVDDVEEWLDGPTKAPWYARVWRWYDKGTGSLWIGLVFFPALALYSSEWWVVTFSVGMLGVTLLTFALKNYADWMETLEPGDDYRVWRWLTRWTR